MPYLLADCNASTVVRLPRFPADEAGARAFNLDQAVREFTGHLGNHEHHEPRFASCCPACEQPVNIRGSVVEGALAFHAGCR